MIDEQALEDAVNQIRKKHNLMLAGQAILASQVSALESAFVSVCAQLGLTALQGVPIQEWLRRQAFLDLQKMLISVEDDNPALAALLQSHIDDAAKATSGETPQ